MVQFSRNPGIMWNDIANDVVALAPASGLCFGMQDVAADVWRLIAHPTSIDAICDALCSSYDVDNATCRHDVEEFLASLVDEGLVSRND